MLLEPNPSLRDLLAFYVEAGVDCALSEEPIDRLADASVVTVAPAEPAIRQSAPTAPAVMAARPALSIAPEVAVTSARAAAASASTLEDLRALMEIFDGCPLKATASRLVFGDGDPAARVMFVGEAPGREEDIEGVPFVGKSGKLLDLMLAAIGLDRTSAYITNVIAWRPPGNRDPSPQETQICLPFIRRHIELVDPDILVCLGKPSTQTLLGTSEGITRTRGRWFDFETGTRTIRATSTFHPAYLLRSPSHKALAWRDFRAVRKALAADQVTQPN